MSIRGLASATIKYYCVQYEGKVQADVFSRRVTLRQRFPPTSWHAFTAARNDFLQFARNMGSIDYVRVTNVAFGACDGSGDSGPTSDPCAGVTEDVNAIDWSDSVFSIGTGTFTPSGDSFDFSLQMNGMGGGDGFSTLDVLFRLCNRATGKSLHVEGLVSYGAHGANNTIAIYYYIGASQTVIFSVTGSATGQTDVPISFNIPLTDMAVNDIHIQCTEGNNLPDPGFNGSFTVSII